ncbi:hypothetical protein ACJX0J_008660, partial [Zea mays]
KLCMNQLEHTTHISLIVKKISSAAANTDLSTSGLEFQMHPIKCQGAIENGYNLKRKDPGLLEGIR